MAEREADGGSLGVASLGMAVATTTSRGLGFLRTAVWSWALGLHIVGSTYLVANTIPNIVYILLAGGVLNAVFVPQLVRAARRGAAAERDYTDRLLTLAGLVVVVIAVLATCAAPMLVRAYAGQNWNDADLRLAVAFAFWCLPQIAFYGIYTMLGQALNARGRFGAMMWAPVANNLIAILVGVLFIVFGSAETGNQPGASSSLSAGEVAFLGAGTTLGVLVQALILIPALRRAGFSYRPRFDFRGHGLTRAGHLAGWTVLFVLVNQVAFWVVTKVANTAGKAAEGGVSYAVGLPAYNFAYLVLLLPHAIVAVSLMTSLLPRMSAAAAAGRSDELRRDVSTGLRLTATASFPAAAAFLALGPELTRVLLFGNPTPDARYVGLVLMAFAPGLVAFSAQYVALRTFYALEDTKTPFLIQTVIAAVNIATVLVAYQFLPIRWVVVGMAAGYSLTYLIGLCVSVAVLRRRLGRLEGRNVVGVWMRLGAAALPSGLVAFAIARAITGRLGEGLTGSVVALFAAGPILAIGFLLGARLLRLAEITWLCSRLGLRGPHGSASRLFSSR